MYRLGMENLLEIFWASPPSLRKNWRYKTNKLQIHNMCTTTCMFGGPRGPVPWPMPGSACHGGGGGGHRVGLPLCVPAFLVTDTSRGCRRCAIAGTTTNATVSPTSATRSSAIRTSTSATQRALSSPRSLTGLPIYFTSVHTFRRLFC